MTNPEANVDLDAAPELPEARAERLSREMAEHQDLLAITAHELRNPLHALQLQLTLARNGAQSNAEAETLARIDKAQAMLARYSRRVTLLMELIRSGEYPLEIRTLDLRALLESIVDGLQQEARYRGVTLASDLPERCTVRADALLVEQIVDNLLINAFKHSASKNVLLRLNDTADGLCISVADDGRGIDADDQARIFGKFGVARMSGRGNGTGLGLWIVRRLAASLGGHVTLVSAPGQGSTFTFHLPSTERIPT